MNKNGLTILWFHFFFCYFHHHVKALDMDSLDEILLADMLPSAGTQCQFNSPKNYQNLNNTNITNTTTTYTFDHTPSPSTWTTRSAVFEPQLFLAEMSHINTNNINQSWTIRVGTGGNIYSFRGAFGEAIPPQLQNEFNDEVFQSVSVNQDKNRDPDGLPHFIHQAGIYRKDGVYTTKPFFSPSIAKHCKDDTCSFASWGQQAHVQTFHRSDILYFNSYRDCGDGIMEYNSVIHNFATDLQNGDNVRFLNVPWGGTRVSVLRDIILSKPNNSASTAAAAAAAAGGGLDVIFPALAFNNDRAIRNIEDTAGYTIFAESILLPEEVYNATRPFQIPNKLKLILKDTPSSVYKDGHSDRFEAYCLKAGIREAPNAIVSGCRDCNLWFTNARTNEIIHVPIVIHWAWNKNELYFCTDDIKTEEFNKRWLRGDEILVSYANIGKPFEDNLALSFVHGLQQNNLIQRWASSRIIFGTTGQRKRDYQVYTMNPRVQIDPGDTYVYQQYIINGELTEMESRSSAWVNEISEDLFPLGEMIGTEIQLYSNKDDTMFGAANTGNENCPQGENRCIGSSVPELGSRPLFVITCGANKTYVGSDQYYFSPPPNNQDGVLRPYVCDEDDIDVRPNWKLLGFFPDGSCNFLQNATYNAQFCSLPSPTLSSSNSTINITEETLYPTPSSSNSTINITEETLVPTNAPSNFLFEARFTVSSTVPSLLPSNISFVNLTPSTNDTADVFQDQIETSDYLSFDPTILHLCLTFMCMHTLI